jgi:phosphoserine phosphatase RsbU/P
MSGGDHEARLGNLLAVTDVRLSRLDVDEMLVEVLERVRGILEADTAAALLTERGSHELVARAACGLEEEVRQGVRVPIGVGFAGTIAARREPVLLDRVDATTVANPILWEKGIRRMLGVPLIYGDTLLGVLHVGRLEDRSFDLQDAELLQVAGERVAAAVQARRLAVEAAAAAMLERGLLPTRLPELPGLHLAARYAPAQERTIGGDWYDAFVLPSGALWIVIGDVAGHGLNSAVVVSRVKSALRAYSLVGGGPAAVLELTNRKLWHFEVNTIVTVMCAVSEPPYDRFEISSAGHPPAVLARDSGAEFVEVTPGPPLGATASSSYTSRSVEIPDGGTLLFYTDGLVERPGESLDLGLQRLRGVVTNDRPENVCRDVMHALVGGVPTVDDVALLAVQRLRTAPSDVDREKLELVGETRLAPTEGSAAQARTFAVQAAGPITPHVRQTIELLVSEIATNAVLYGRSEFTLRVLRSHDRLRVECTDEGPGLPAIRDAGPTDTHGRGLRFVDDLAESWGVEAADDGLGKTVWFTVALAMPRPDRLDTSRWVR